MDLQIATTTVSVANQTAIPSLVRKQLNIKPGDKLLWRVDKKSQASTVSPVPKRLGDYMLGLGKEIWKDVNTDEYIRELRKDRKI